MYADDALLQLSLHENYAGYMESTLSLATSQGLVLPPRSSATKSVLNALKASLTLTLPDEDVGAILGKKGQTLADIQQVSGRHKWHCGCRRRSIHYQDPACC